MRRTILGTLAVVAAALASAAAQQQPASDAPQDGRFKFKASVDLINVTATVSDERGRFVSGLRKEDFVLYEDDVQQPITNFSADRVPVSLGIVLDTSGSMDGNKIKAARSALSRLLDELGDPADEFFMYRFASEPLLLQGWTSDRRAIERALDRTEPQGDTAMYDAVARAVLLAARGKNQKKAVIVISDGNDTVSKTRTSELRQIVRESEVLVYSIGIDGDDDDLPRPGTSSPLPSPPTTFPPRTPFPIPAPRPFPPRRFSSLLPQISWPGTRRRSGGYDENRVNDVALRDLTDDSGGRTEIIRGSRDLGPATSSIADELTKQYYLGYSAPGERDGRWHAIRVEVARGAYTVRARRGYVAS